MAKAGAFICPPDIAQRFSHYMGGRPVLFDMYAFSPPTLKQQNPNLLPDALQSLLKEKQGQAAGLIKQVMEEGRSVALLDYGDPAIFTGNVWVKDLFAEKDLTTITGISSFNAANALLNKRFDGNRSIVLTTPWDMAANPALLKAAAARGDAVVLFFPLTNLSTLMPLLRDCYPPATPAFIVYKAGYEGGEEVVETTIDRLQAAVEQREEKMLALLYIGTLIKKNVL
jgi:precorrin-4 methylase